MRNVNHMGNSVPLRSFLFVLLCAGILVWLIALGLLMISSYLALDLLNSVLDLAQLS